MVRVSENKLEMEKPEEDHTLESAQLQVDMYIRRSV